MSSTKTFAICLPVIFAIFGVLAALIPEPTARLLAIAVLLATALATPYVFQRTTGRSLQLDGLKSPLTNSMFFMLNPVFWVFIMLGVIGQEWYHYIVVVSVTAFLIMDISLEQFDVFPQSN